MEEEEHKGPEERWKWKWRRKRMEGVEGRRVRKAKGERGGGWIWKLEVEEESW